MNPLPVTFEGWERWTTEHPELLLLPPQLVAKCERQAQADLARQIFLIEVFANQRIER